MILTNENTSGKIMNHLFLHIHRIESLKKTKGNKNGQSRDTGNIGHTRNTTKTNPETLVTLGTQETRQRQSRDTGNIGHTRNTTKTIQRHWQPLGTQETRQRRLVYGVRRHFQQYFRQLYRGSQFYWWRKPEYHEKTTMNIWDQFNSTFNWTF
jgi:hypothetical protein